MSAVAALPVVTHGRALVRRRLSAIAFCCCAGLASGPASGADAGIDRLIFLLQYAGSDYPNAVAGNAVTNEAEYQEIRRFLQIVRAHDGDLLAVGGTPELLAAIRHLDALVDQHAAPTTVRQYADALVQRLLQELPLGLPIAAVPDLGRGARLFADACAPCHGSDGRGDGHLARGLVPQPTSLRDARMAGVSPLQIFGAMRFGIEGTAMPSFEAACTNAELWDIAFFVATLRDGFAPRTDDPGLSVELVTLANRPTDTLLAELRVVHADASLADVDYYRAHPGRTAATTSPTVRPPVQGGDVAQQLETLFVEVGKRVMPSVVGVSAFARQTPAEAAAMAQPPPDGWAAVAAEDDPYPGFRRTRSASGFVVSADGDILTCSDVLFDQRGQPVEVVDVEYRDGQHLLARVVGVEPTIHLGVLQPAVVPYRGLPATAVAVPIRDDGDFRAGQWTIGLGDPWGPSTAFGVGVIASEPTRQCYQENLTSTLVQSSMQMHPEACGGPMADLHGDVIGLLVPAPGVQATLGGAQPTFALPMSVAIGIYRSLKVKESRVSPWLGFAVLEIPAARQRLGDTPAARQLPQTGVYIDDLFTPSPAAAADVRIGDSLTAVDGHRLLSVLDFQQQLYLAGVGRRVTLELVRGGQRLHKQVSVEQRPPTATTR